VIDLDRMEAQLAAALTEGSGPPQAAVRHQPAPAPAPTPAPAPAAAPRARRRPVSRPEPVTASSVPRTAAGVRELLELGMLDEVAARAAGGARRLDQVTWTTMRALLEGRRDATQKGIAEAETLGKAGDAEAQARACTQRFWAAFEWGADDERLDVLDLCRTRAYRYDDLEWWGNLTVLLAVMGKDDEAVRAFDATLPLLAAAPRDAVQLDVVTNLVEAAALLRRPDRVALAGRQLRTPTGHLVVVGEAVVCKGSVDRYLGLIHAAVGDSARAGGYFRSAEAAHRAMGAEPLLARTLQQASRPLAAA
jgi:hypothetical protein